MFVELRVQPLDDALVMFQQIRGLVELLVGLLEVLLGLLALVLLPP